MRKALTLAVSNTNEDMRNIEKMVKKCNPEAIRAIMNHRARIGEKLSATTSRFLDEEITIKEANEANSLYLDSIGKLQELANKFKAKCVCKLK